MRDWGHAEDYIKMQWLMLQAEEPDDFVIATGEQHSVREFVTWSARELGISLTFEGQGVEERAIVSAIAGNDAPALSVGDVICRVDQRYFRPAEVETLLGDASKAYEKLGWEPSWSVSDLCADMTAKDLKAAKRDVLLQKHGFDVLLNTD